MRRIEHVKKLLETKNLDAIVINSASQHDFTTKPNIFYLTNFLGVWPCSLAITKDGTTLYTNEMDKAPKQSSVKDLQKTEGLKKLFEEFKGKNIGIDGDSSFKSHAYLMKSNLVDISNELLRIRAIKDQEEITKIEHACKHTEKFFDAVELNLNAGTEKRIDLAIKETALRNNVSLSFPNIVAGDANSSEVHYMDNNGKFSKILMADIGAQFDNYNSDFTRTFLLKPTEEMKKAKEALIELHGKLEDLAVPGALVKDLSKISIDFLNKKGYRNQQFGNFHALGHGVGLEVHEYPGVGLGEEVLEENMVITLEPAIYFESKFGIRLEDTCLVKKKKIKRLTKLEL